MSVFLDFDNVLRQCCFGIDVYFKIIYTSDIKPLLLLCLLAHKAVRSRINCTGELKSTVRNADRQAGE